jgi:hypothetical protein
MMEDLIIRMTVREFIVPLSGTVNLPLLDKANDLRDQKDEKECIQKMIASWLCSFPRANHHNKGLTPPASGLARVAPHDEAERMH